VKKQGSSALVILTITILVTCTVAADHVALKNGDHVTGQLKKLEQGVLYLEYFKNTIQIPWEEVSEVESAERFHLTLKDGQTIVGSIRPSGRGLTVSTTETGTVDVALQSVDTIRSAEAQTAYVAEIERLRNPGLLDLWSGFLDTGLAMTQGNAESTTLNLTLSTARTSPRDKISVKIASLYARSDTSGTTANTIRGGFRYDVNVSPRLFGFGFTDLEYDEFQGLDLRFVPGGGLGFHWVKTDQTRFDVFGGGSLNREFYTSDIDRTSGEVVIGEELFHQLFSASHLEHTLVLFPNVSNTGEYRISTDNALVTKLNRWLSWELSLSDRLNSNPIPGKKKNDVLFTTGLRFTFE